METCWKQSFNEVGHRDAMFVTSYANKSHALSCNPLGDHMMPRAEVQK